MIGSEVRNPACNSMVITLLCEDASNGCYGDVGRNLVGELSKRHAAVFPGSSNNFTFVIVCKDARSTTVMSV